MLSAVYHKKGACNGFWVILMGITMEGIEVAKTVSSCLAMFSKDGLKLNRNLDNNWRCKLNLFQPKTAQCENRVTGARSYRNVNHPVCMADLLVMPQLGDDLTRCGPLSEKRTLCNKFANDD